MTWTPELERLKRLKELAGRMGGEENVAKHHGRGKLTVRERLGGLADPGSFEEIGALTGSARYEADELLSFTPANTVMGFIRLDGRKAVVSGGDFTVRGGAADAAVANKSQFAERLALDWRLPYIRLLDATGGSVRTFEQIGHTYIPDNPGGYVSTRLLQEVPVVSAVMGSVAGLPAVHACLAHFNLMVKGTSQVFVAGPPVVQAAFGSSITKEELGNERIQAYESGAVNNVAENEAEAFALIRRFLSYLPGNVYEMPPRVDPDDDPDRRDEALLSIIPREERKPYDPYVVLRASLDQGSFFEIAPRYGRSRITGLARVHGYPVGVMINNPRFLGGSMDAAAGEKVIRLIQLCDLFHLPLAYFADEPGFLIGLRSEKRGILRAGARVVMATSTSRMPWITFILRQLYGVAGGCHMRTTGMYKRYSWPSGNWGSMHIRGGTRAAYRREIEAAPDPEAKRQEIEARLDALASPFRTAHAFKIEDIVDPRETRPLLVRFVEDAQAVLRTQLGPAPGLAFWP
jgi:acetyl-CoA carboxylase carboxyltransferase component